MLWTFKDSDVDKRHYFILYESHKNIRIPSVTESETNLSNPEEKGKWKEHYRPTVYSIRILEMERFLSDRRYFREKYFPCFMLLTFVFSFVAPEWHHGSFCILGNPFMYRYYKGAESSSSNLSVVYMNWVCCWTDITLPPHFLSACFWNFRNVQ